MSKIKFSTQQTEVLIIAIQQYFEEKLEQEIGQFDAEFLLDFFSEKVGAYYYNQGLHDAKSLLESKVETIMDGFYEIEKVTDFS